MADEPAPLEVAARLVGLFEQRGIPFAIGGALAYGYWAPARGTHDVDMNVFAGEERVDEVVELLQAEGFQVDGAQAHEAVATGGHVKAWWRETPVDLFFNSIPLHDAIARRVVRVPFAGGTAPVLSAEDTILLKLLFFRPKDLLDIERVIGTQRARLDRDYVRSWIVEMVGDDDKRTRKWDELCGELPPG